MKQLDVRKLAAYFDDEITSMPNLTTAATLVTVSALNAGSISSGFGNIDNGSSTLNTGVATVASMVYTAGATFGDGYGSTGATISTAGVIQADGNIETAGSFVIGNASMNEADLEKLDGVTAGTAAASKAMVLDSNADISGGRNLTISGELDAATGDFSGNVDIAGDLTLSAGADGALRFSAASSIKMLDNSATALVIEEANNAYLTFSTDDSNPGLLVSQNMRMADGKALVFDADASEYIKDDSGNLEFGSNSALLFAAPTNIFYSSTAEKPTVTIKNTNDDADGGALVFQKDGTSAADNDILGSMSWAGENDNASPESITYASISAKSADVSDGSEDGSVHFVAKVAGSDSTWMDFNSTTANTVTLASSVDIKARTFITYSDRTLKTNIQTMDNCLEKVMALEPTTYDKVASGKSEIGFIAQDVAKVVPEICALDANGEGRGIDYSRMSTLLVGALKAQQEQIAQLKEIVVKLQK